MKRTSPLAAGILALVATLPLGAFPLDGADFSMIARLKGYQWSQRTPGASKLPPGALLSIDDMTLSLEEHPDVDVLEKPQDPELRAALERIFSKRSASYSVVVVDYTDPENLAWAGLREDETRLPGSVGKLGILVGLFDGLRRVTPDLGERERLLKGKPFAGGAWAVGDSHTVPVYNPATGRNVHRKMNGSDAFRLAEWLDHMASASANSAASVVWREAMLLRHFGEAYPPTPAARDEYFRKTPRGELQKQSLRVIEEPLQAAGIRAAGFRQGTMFTRAAKRAVPGTRSFASPLELARVLLRLEQGRLVDAWSSLQIKRYLYLTKRRVRYAHAPELKNAALYFKSGSVYSCHGPGKCTPFEGTRRNIMNSVCMVESPAAPGPGQKRYLVALMSNVLGKNSAWEHSRIAAEIEKAIHARVGTLPMRVEE